MAIGPWSLGGVTMSRMVLLGLVAVVGVVPWVPAADEIPPQQQYQRFLQKYAAQLRQNDKAPATLDEWTQHEGKLRQQLYAAWGGEACFLKTPCDLEPQTHGEPLRRDGYTVEKITFQTRPGLRMTANLYVPDAAKKKPAPAILMVHGHWRGAKQEPTVQARCIGAAKLGFVVLCVDAFGAGERGIGTALGEYHGEMTAATLWPLGLTLSGLQVYENMRAVDYLETRPEVDKTRIGITGASGGGNQTMYAGAWDKRFKCVVPVCSVGSYQAYLQVACCMCEVVPGALQFTEEWAVLGLIAPRPLMVINATGDSIQFSVAEAKKTLALTRPIYKLYGKDDHLVHTIIESQHDYNKPMREAMYGFMTRHLKGEGNGEPIPEPELKTENPEDLRCFPGNTRPKDFLTLPQFAAQEAKKLRDQAEWFGQNNNHAALRQRHRRWMTSGADVVPPGLPPPVWKQEANGRWKATIPSAPGITLSAIVEGDSHDEGPVVVLLHLDGAETARRGELYAALRQANVRVITFDLRGTGALAPERNRVGRAVDHNAAQWALWLGWPLLVQWVGDVQQVMRAYQKHKDRSQKGEFILIGEGPAGLVALATSAWTPDGIVGGVGMVNTLATLVTDRPYTDQRLGILAPGFLRDWGDIGHFASLDASTPLVIGGGVSGDGQKLSAEQLRQLYQPAFDSAQALGLGRRIVITTPEQVLKELGLIGAQDEKPEPIFEPGAELKKLVGEGAAGEGPAWDKELGVLTSGRRGIHQFTPQGEAKVWRENAGTNGLLFDREGRLVCCEPATRSVSRITRDGQRTVLTDRFNGKKYNTPNDLTIDSKNRIYFSDPRYGNRDDMQQKDEQGRTIEGVYRIDPDGTVHRVIGREVQRANGVLVSADDKYLFVADNNNNQVGGARKLWRFDLKADGSVDPKSQKLLYDWGTGRGPDGVKQDLRGRLYVAAGLNKPNPPAEPATDVKGGIYVIDPETGKLLAFLAVPTDEVTNCAFGDDDRKTLYITGGGTLYSIRTTTPGRILWPPK